MEPHWEHYPHQADIGVRGFGPTKAEAFAQTALALMAVMIDLETVAPDAAAEVTCEAPDDDTLLLDWLNALVFEVASRGMVFARFEVAIAGGRLTATAWGEPLDRARHAPAVEIKGATYTDVEVVQDEDGWRAQCVVDV